MAVSTDACPYCGAPLSAKTHQEIRARLAGEEAERLAQHDQQMRDQFTREKTRLEGLAQAAIQKASRDAVKATEKKLALLRKSQEAAIAARVAAEREKAAKAQGEAVNAAKLEHAAEKLKLETALADMQRRLQAKTAHALGEPAEIDLHAMLVAAFPNDRVNRVPKGQPGPDVVVEVVRDDAVIGSIVLDSKNHARWSNRFTSKLRSDQLVVGADFAILSTTTFPSGVRELHLQGGVIVASPQRVVVLVALLRQQIVQNHVFKRGAESRNEKAEQLYDFLLSPAGDEMFDRLLRTTRALESLDAAEVKSHQTNWAKRAELVREIAAVREQFCDMLSEIIGGGR